MSTEETNIEKRLREWIESQGYPLEMFVAVAFQSEGFRAIQSEYYADPETGVMREVESSLPFSAQLVGSYSKFVS